MAKHRAFDGWWWENVEDTFEDLQPQAVSLYIAWFTNVQKYRKNSTFEKQRVTKFFNAPRRAKLESLPLFVPPARDPEAQKHP